jgi:hypothetical protein
MLVEVMMSALLVAVAATAVFKGIDGANATSTQSKARAVAGNLAHEDQERLRAMDPRKLASYSPTPSQKVVNGVQYTVTSTAQWVSDRGESESCTKGEGRVVYVRINSTVTWPDMRGSKPVVASSLVSISNAYAKGSIAIKIVDRTGSTGVPDVPVTIDAPVNQSKSTNDVGCVVFDGLTTGAYTGQFSKAGYVDFGGNNVVRPANGFSVTTGSTAVSTFAYDRAANAAFKFVTRVNGSEIDTTSPGLLLKNPQLPAGGQRREIFSSNQSTWGYTNLFPFNSGYTAFAVACTADTPTGTGTTLTSPPAGASLMQNSGQPDHNTSPVKVFLPSLNLRVTRNGSTTNNQNMRVWVRPDTATDPAACGRTQVWAPALTPAAPMGSDGWAPANASRGFTPGRYRICADDRPYVTRDRDAHRVEQSVDLRNGADATLTINVNGSSTSNPCP